MAQFKSSAQEGSFSSNQLIVPDEVRKIQNEGNRRLQGMSTAQAHLQKNQQLFLQAQEQAQAFQQDDRDRARSINSSNISAQKASAADNWQRALAQEEAKNKNKVDTFSTLAAFSKTAFDITAGIVQQNKDNQLKAINQVAFKHQLSYKDLLNAQSVNSSISNAAWQETNIVQDYLKEGKSQDFINAMYDHLIKGGGYRNYINNSNVLTETARTNSRVFDRIANDPSLSVQQKRKAIATKESQMRGALEIDGKIPGIEILEKAYNPTIRQALSRSDNIINKETRAKLQETNTNYRIAIVDQAAFSSGVFNATAVMSKVSNDPRPNAINEAVSYLIPKLDQKGLSDLRDAPFDRNGQTVSIGNGGYLDARAAINAALQDRRNESIKKVALEEQAKQLKTRMAMNAKAQELQDDDGLFSTADSRELFAYGDEVYGGPGRDTTNDNFYKRQTADSKLVPVMMESLEEMRLDRTLSVAELKRINPPKAVFDQFIGPARDFDNARNSDEYKNINKYLKERIVGSIKQLSKLKYSQSGAQSDQFNWYVGEQVKIYRKAFMDAVLVGEDPKTVLNVIGDQAAKDSLTKLEANGALTSDGITSYNEEMNESTVAQKVIQKKISSWRKLKPIQQKKPENWLSVIGEQSLASASEELARTGKSEVLSAIAASTNLTQYEVQQKIAEVSDTIEPVELSQTYAEIQSAWSADQRFSFTSNLTTNEQKLRTLQKQINEFENRNSYAIRDSLRPDQAVMTGVGEAPEDDTQALLDVSNELGINALDLASIIGYETGGTYSPNQWGGHNGQYMGLIQFGPEERAAYGVVEGMSFRNQLLSVAAFLKDRFEGVGMSTQGASLLDLYTTVLGGNPKANRDGEDSNKTTPNIGVSEMGPHREKAARRYGLK